MKFQLGRTVVTLGVDNEIPVEEIQIAFNRHKRGDWGNLCDEDKKMNDQAVESGEDRIVSKYESKDGKEFYIITEWNRSYTTALLVEEY